jgi:16S rRNA (uracil1498-N3)-methyltransferase
MSERFFLGSIPQSGRAVLAGDEARHLVRVLRAGVGAEIRVFDGAGGEWRARIASIGRDEVTLDIGAPLPAAPAVEPSITIAVALPKGERQKWLVEKLTELGVARLVPLVTARGVAEAVPAALERLRRGVVEACKQCGRSVLMEIGEPATVAEACAAAEGPVILCDPGGPPLDAASLRATTAVLGLVGPEGGFTAEEEAAMVAVGAVRAGLGPHVLRVETAAIALAAAVTAGSRGPAPA